MPLLAQSIADLVAQDGQPRQATADDGSEHMLFRDGLFVRSCVLANWPAEQVILAAHEQERLDAAALRQRILTAAQSAVGVQLDQLTAVQIRALLAIVLFKAGAVGTSGVVQPLNTWT